MLKYSNIYVIHIPKRKYRENGGGKLLKKYFFNCDKMHKTQAKGVHQSTSMIQPNKILPTHITVKSFKLLKNQKQEGNLIISWRKKTFFKETTIRLIADYSAEAMEVR